MSGARISSLGSARDSRAVFGDSPKTPNGSAESATSQRSTRADMAGDNTPTHPGAEASKASSGIVEHSKHPPGERAESAAVAISGSEENQPS